MLRWLSWGTRADEWRTGDPTGRTRKVTQARQPGYVSASDPSAEGVRPEHELLLCVAHVPAESERVERMRALLRNPIEWDYLLRAAPQHGLLPLLYWHLKLNAPQEAYYLRSHYDYAFRSDDGKSLVELHWGITPAYFSFALDFEGLWANVDTTFLGGREIPTFCPEDYLLLLAVHGCKHLWKQLNWIVDIAELVRVHRTLDWSRLIGQSEQRQCRRVLLLAILLAHDLLDAPVPEEALKLA